MNTRRQVAKTKPEVHSTKWHLLHESYYPIFAEATRGSVEDWYNLEASGAQRDQFRALCHRVYTTAPVSADDTATIDAISSSSTAAAAATRKKGALGSTPTQTEAVLRQEEARTILLQYGEVLSVEGKARARGWLLQPATTARDKTLLREMLLGCQPHKAPKSVLKTDYTPPARLDDKVYDNVDRTHFQRSVDWNNLKAREEMQQVQQQRSAHDAQSAHMAVIGSSSSTDAHHATDNKKRITKPKNQFDNVNYLSSLGYDNVSKEEALADIQRRRAEGNGASGPAGTYEVREDGSTVYTAGAGRQREGDRQKPNNLMAVNAEPMAEWKVKTLQ